MSNPVTKIQSKRGAKNQKDLRFPTSLGKSGEHNFAFFVIKEIQPGHIPPITIGSLALPMPLDLVDSYKVEYSDANLGPLGATAVGVGSSIASEFSYENIKESLMAGGNAFNSNMFSQVVARKAIEFLPGIDSGDARATAGQIVTSATNKAINPYITGVFKGVGFRTHNFTFRCNPRKKPDSDALLDIIKFLKESMLPADESISATGSTGPAGQHDFKYQQKTGLQSLPHRFDINFHTRNELEGGDVNIHGSKYLFRIQDAAMTSFSVDYETEGAPGFFKKTSAPITTVLNMTFSESKVYTRESVEREIRDYNIRGLDT